MNVDEEYAPGLWRPSVPLPYWGLFRVQCFECRRWFWGLGYISGKAYQRYERHYRREHFDHECALTPGHEGGCVCSCGDRYRPGTTGGTS